MKMKKGLLVWMITLTLGATTSAFAAPASSFNDVPKDHFREIAP